MVAASVREEIQDADAGYPWPARLPPRRERRPTAFHHAADGRRAVKDALLSRRRPLGAEAAEFSTLVQNRERLGRSMDEEVADPLGFQSLAWSMCCSSDPGARGATPRASGTAPRRRPLTAEEPSPEVSSGNISKTSCSAAVVPVET